MKPDSESAERLPSISRDLSEDSLKVFSISLKGAHEILGEMKVAPNPMYGYYNFLASIRDLDAVLKRDLTIPGYLEFSEKKEPILTKIETGKNSVEIQEGINEIEAWLSEFDKWVEKYK